MTIDIKQLRDEHIAKLQEGFAKALDEFSPDRALYDLTARLSDARQQAVWNLLGLTDKWGKWEASGGYGTPTPIQKWMSAEIADKLHAFMNELIADELDGIKESMHKQIKAIVTKKIKEQAQWDLERKVEATVDEISNKVVEEVRKEITKELGL